MPSFLLFEFTTLFCSCLAMVLFVYTEYSLLGVLNTYIFIFHKTGKCFTTSSEMLAPFVSSLSLQDIHLILYLGSFQSFLLKKILLDIDMAQRVEALAAKHVDLLFILLKTHMVEGNS